MINALRLELTAYTASFRVPGFVAHQLTLPVPPLSTIYGLLSAAAGRWVSPDELEWLAYRCDYEGKATDLETIITVKWQDGPKVSDRNVLRREFLVLPRLTLYLPADWGQAFSHPRYHLLLGRTQDVATVESMAPVTLEPADEGETSGTLLPLELMVSNRNHINAWLQNLPIAFSGTPHRKLLGMRVFGVVDAKQSPALIRTPSWLVRDGQTGETLPLYRRSWVQDVLRSGQN